MQRSPEGNLIVRTDEPEFRVVCSAAQYGDSVGFLRALNDQRIANVDVHQALGLQLTDEEESKVELFENIIGLVALKAARDFLDQVDGLVVEEHRDPDKLQLEKIRARKLMTPRHVCLEGKTNTPITVERDHLPIIMSYAMQKAERIAELQDLLERVQRGGITALNDHDYLEAIELEVPNIGEAVLDDTQYDDKEVIASVEESLETAKLARSVVYFFLDHFMPDGR